MAEEVLPLAVFFVDVESFWIYTSEGRLVKGNFPKDLVKDFEVINKAKLIEAMKGFVDSQKVVRSSLIYVIADKLCFTKDFPENLTEEKEGQTRSFFESIPFERVLSRVYPLDKGSRAIGLNRDFFQTLRDAFEVSGFSTFGVVPVYVFTLLNISGSETEIGQQTIKRNDQVKQYTMVLVKQTAVNLQQKEEALAQKHTPLILLVFFIFLFTVIGATIFGLRQQSLQNQATPARVSPRPSPSAPAAAPKPASSPASSSAVLNATSGGSLTR